MYVCVYASKKKKKNYLVFVRCLLCPFFFYFGVEGFVLCVHKMEKHMYRRIDWNYILFLVFRICCSCWCFLLPLSKNNQPPTLLRLSIYPFLWKKHMHNYECKIINCMTTKKKEWKKKNTNKVECLELRRWTKGFFGRNLFTNVVFLFF